LQRGTRALSGIDRQPLGSNFRLRHTINLR
jgi:hypothetical protein